MSANIKPELLANERSAQKRYATKVREKLDKPAAVSGPRNTLWTGTGLTARPLVTGTQLIGRIGLMHTDPLLNNRNDFYIGETRIGDLDGVEVFSWAAPVACTFFRGSNHHVFCNDVAAVRSFIHRGGQIDDFTDEVLQDSATTPFTIRRLEIPAAPNRSKLGTLPGRIARTGQPTSNPAVAEFSAMEAMAPSERAVNPRSALKGDAPVRAENLLRERLLAPRSRHLTSVLSTLQSDQYDLVSVLPDKSMIIEGQPGTGKTIVAAHRAAFMIDEQAPASKLIAGDVLVIGPTPGYSNHVRGVIDSLTGNSTRVRILAMSELMNQILGEGQERTGPVSTIWQDVDAKLGMLVRSAVIRHRREHAALPTLQAVYEQLRLNSAEGRPLTREDEWESYLLKLPPLERAWKLRRHVALMAFIRWELKRPRELARIQHIIVDEAQDVTPLEWFLLQAINTKNAWTILGDLNQRRSDHTMASWDQVLEILGLANSDAPIKNLERGYRSTKPILDFANRLLPKSERRTLAFQTDGPSPKVTKSRPVRLGNDFLMEVNRLVQAYNLGTISVITVDPNSTRSILRSAGWTLARGNVKVWERQGNRVSVLHPDDARGLEFDAVIVLEPGDFPENFGRQGPLYTSLTRPNRELAIIHTKALPRALRKQ